MAIKPVDKLDGKEKKQRKELAYEWIARYNDGTELKQYDDEKRLVYHFGHIDQEKVIEFVLESKTDPKFTVSVNLKTGLFYINKKPIRKIRVEKTHMPLGLYFGKKKVVSPWGNKAKLIFVRHVRRDFNMGTRTMGVSMTYEIGWQAKVDGKHEKHRIILDERGHFGIPLTSELEGFKAL